MIKYIGPWSYKIDPSKLRESIDFTDAYNRLIFEGDIIKYVEKLDDHGDSMKYTGIVKYDYEKEEFGIMGKSCFLNYFSDTTISKFFILGNIDKHPNLVNLLS